MRVLITGGAGFLGSHLADELLAAGHEVRALDSLVEQVHGGTAPDYLDPQVELQVGDVRDPEAVVRALDGRDAVVHFAARVGVGQSMYELAEYTSVNELGTAVLLEELSRRPVERLVVASSMSVYGEGLYEGGAEVERTREQLERGEWEPGPPPLPTPETKPLALASIYALSKYAQERACLIAGAAYGIPAVALRFFNVYGPRQALSNPYTGVLAIFASRLVNGKPPLIYEDGLQRRDFVSVHDVARATRLALETGGADGRVVNVGSGVSVTVRELAVRLAEVTGIAIEPETTGDYRFGDIRHCFADISLARRLLGYEPRVGLTEGMSELAEWLSGQTAAENVDEAHAELRRRGLTI
ncbi:MAG TPA: NAD-dependent epimerase/dehydratase family protein [Gaiellaceae bacterium]|jgi:dTDP-L-rhamnose 4-epimerase